MRYKPSKGRCFFSFGEIVYDKKSNHPDIAGIYASCFFGGCRGTMAVDKACL